MGAKVDAVLGILNGVVGDYLDRTGNPLATQMTCSGEGTGRRAVVLIHGLMGTLAHWAFPNGDDYGALLKKDLGWAPRYVTYNTGLPISQNGAALDAVLERLVDGWEGPMDELMLVGHSMGGLVARAACHVAAGKASRWLPKVKRAIYVGTPHLGAPMEKVGRVVAQVLHAVPDPYTQLVGQIADLRSTGIKDLGDAKLSDAHHPVPLLPGIRHVLIAGTVHESPLLAALFGDTVVPLSSATQGLLDAHIIPGVTHMALAHHPLVYDAILEAAR